MSENDPQPSSNEPNEPPSGLEPEPLTPPSTPISEPERYTADTAPYPWAVGKTVAESLDMAQTAFDALQTGQSFNQPTPAAPANPAPAPVPEVPGVPTFDPYSEQFSQNLAAHIKSEAQREAQILLTAQAAPYASQLGQLARDSVAKSTEFSDVFTQYGPEIDAEFAKNNVSPQNRTIDAYKFVANYIRGRHYRDMVHAEAERMLSSGDLGTVRTGSGVGIEPELHQDALDIFWDSDNEYVRSAKLQHLTKATVRETISLQGLKVDEWVKLMSGDNVIISPDGKRMEIRRVVK